MRLFFDVGGEKFAERRGLAVNRPFSISNGIVNFFGVAIE